MTDRMQQINSLDKPPRESSGEAKFLWHGYCYKRRQKCNGSYSLGEKKETARKRVKGVVEQALYTGRKPSMGRGCTQQGKRDDTAVLRKRGISS
jgi:hypothetical protein